MPTKEVFNILNQLTSKLTNKVIEHHKVLEERIEQIESLEQRVVALESILNKMNDILFNGVVIIDNGNGYPIEAKRELQTLIEDLK